MSRAGGIPGLQAGEEVNMHMWVEKRQVYEAGETWIEVRSDGETEEQRHVLATPWAVREPRGRELPDELKELAIPVFQMALKSYLNDTVTPERLRNYLRAEAMIKPGIESADLDDFTDYVLAWFFEMHYKKDLMDHVMEWFRE